VLHVLCPHWRHVHAAADPTHVHPIDVQTFAWFCREWPGTAPWRPLCVRADEATVHADLQPAAVAPDEAEMAAVFG
jgi:hypothetical protein